MGNVNFLFETEDGTSGDNPCNDSDEFTRYAFDPKVVAKILVHNHSQFISGITLFD